MVIKCSLLAGIVRGAGLLFGIGRGHYLRRHSTICDPAWLPVRVPETGHRRTSLRAGLLVLLWVSHACSEGCSQTGHESGPRITPRLAIAKQMCIW